MDCDTEQLLAIFSQKKPKRMLVNTVVMAIDGGKVYVAVVKNWSCSQVTVVWAKMTTNNSCEYIFRNVCSVLEPSEVFAISSAYIMRDDVVCLPSPLNVILERLLGQPVCGVVSNSTYKSSEKAKNKTKNDINVELAVCAENARLLCAVTENLPTAALYLDADTACTTETLLRHTSYNVTQLYCPNTDPNHALQIRKAHPGVHSDDMEVSQFIQQKGNKLPLLLSFVWIDGMSTWKGSKPNPRCTQKAVKSLFVGPTNMLAPYCVVAYTISTRGVKGPRKDEHDRVLKFFVRRWIQKAKYVVVEEKYLKCDTVFTTMLKIKKKHFYC